MVDGSARHTPKLGKFIVWSDTQGVLFPKDTYEHKIGVQDGKWTCTVVADQKPCWEHRIRGLFCSHMCAYAVGIIRAGGFFDPKVVGNSCLARHRTSDGVRTLSLSR